MEAGKVLTLLDSTKFETGDSIHTKAEFWPMNRISYTFFPKPDTTFKDCTVVEYQRPKPWATINLAAMIPLTDEDPIYARGSLLFDMTNGYHLG